MKKDRLNNSSGKPDTKEIASAGGINDITRHFRDAKARDYRQSFLSNLCAGEDGWWDLAEFTRSDSRVAAVFQQRILSVTSYDWEITPGDETPQAQEAADFIKAQIKHIRFNDITEKLLWARFYGYSVAEAIWKISGNQYVLDAIKVRNARRFAFRANGELLLRTFDNYDGIELPDKKFMVIRSGATHSDKPYGEGLIEWLYWPARFKRLGISEWALFLEKFASPTVVGKYPNNTSEKEAQALLAVAQNIRTDTAAVMPENMLIELIEGARSGRADYLPFAESMEKIITQVILGQTMTTDDGSSNSQAQVHQNVANKFVKSDIDMVTESFNDTIIKWLMAWNFDPKTPMPLLTRPMPDKTDEVARSGSYKTLYEIGFKPTQERVDSDFGEGFEKDLSEPKTEKSQEKSQENFAEQDLTEKATDNKDRADDITALLEKDDADAMQTMLSDIIEDMETSTTLEEFAEKLEATRKRPLQFIDKWVERLASALIFSNIKGVDDVSNDRASNGTDEDIS